MQPAHYTHIDCLLIDVTGLKKRTRYRTLKPIEWHIAFIYTKVPSYNTPCHFFRIVRLVMFHISCSQKTFKKLTFEGSSNIEPDFKYSRQVQPSKFPAFFLDRMPLLVYLLCTHSYIDVYTYTFISSYACLHIYTDIHMYEYILNL